MSSIRKRRVSEGNILILVVSIIFMMILQLPDETEALVPFANKASKLQIHNPRTNIHKQNKHIFAEENSDFSLDIDSDELVHKHPLYDIYSIVRGGSAVLDHSSRRTRKTLIMSIALFTTYFSVMGAKCALPSTFNLITSKSSGLNFTKDPQSMMSTVLMISTSSIALGKLLLGPVIDKFGGVLCLKVALTTLLLSLGIIAQTSSFRIFAISWVVVDFVFSSCWAACLSSIHSTFDEQDWAGKIGLLAVAGRIGNAMSFFAFASILQSFATSASSWRLVFWLSSSLQLVPLFMFMLFSHVSKDDMIDKDTDSMIHNENQESIENTSNSATTSMKESIRILIQEAQFPAFWMHMIARSSLMIIASFLLFVPSYMSTGFGMSSANASRVAALYAIGSMLAVSFGAKKFSSSDVNRQCIAIVTMLGSLIGVCVLQIMHICGKLSLTPIIGGVSMLIWGLAFSVPFYIPCSMYALRVGGRKSAATIADAFDLVGFSMLAWFNGFVARRSQDLLVSWLSPFAILGGFAWTGLVTLVLALKLDQNNT